MSKQKKMGQGDGCSCLDMVFDNLETIFLFTVYVAANCAACYTDPESGAMMLVPSTLLLKRAKIVNDAFFLFVVFAACGYLLANTMDAFFIIIVHGIFLGVVTWQKAARANAASEAEN
ncbi:hypothetical protein BsWGS_17739 [Bradybaena similaris]